MISEINFLGCFALGATVNGFLENQPQARDCWDLRSIYNVTNDGVYSVLSPDGKIINVRCDMITDGGGWIIFQKRHDGKVNFLKNWAKYKEGFGTIEGHDEFWMGNDFIHEFTRDRRQKLRVDICSWPDVPHYATYDFFLVGPESDKYRLSVASYTGNAGDALITGSGGNQKSNNMQFSTAEQDNDISSHNCANDYQGAWWFGDCISAHLNGVYQRQSLPDSVRQGLIWRPLTENYSFKGSEMKFRPAHVTSSNAAFSCPIH